MRRFWARPSAVSFEAIGWFSPCETATIWLDGTPSACISRTTLAARTPASSQFDGKRSRSCSDGHVVGEAEHGDLVGLLLDLGDELAEHLLALGLQVHRAAREQHVVGQRDVEAVRQQLHLDRAEQRPGRDLVGELLLLALQLLELAIAQLELHAQAHGDAGDGGRLAAQALVLLGELVALRHDLVVRASRHAAGGEQGRRQPDGGSGQSPRRKVPEHERPPRLGRAI
jgi:hypothetical protein